MQTKDCIIGRRSIRKFTSQKVEKETLEGIVGLAAYAPSWKNTQVTRYYAITDQAIKDEIAENCTLGYDGNTRIIKGFGLRQGITHSEFIMDGNEIYLIETAARGGGVFISSDLIHLSCGLDTEKFLLDIATGQQHGLPEILPQQCVCGYLAFYIPTGTVVSVQGVQDVLALPYVHRNQLGKLRVGMVNEDGHTDKTSRLALIVSAPDRRTFEARAKTIRDLLKVETMTRDGIKPLIWE